MKMEGLLVKHKTLGTGTVTKFDGNFLTVSFESKVSMFQYPVAFTSFIQAADPADQVAILQEIEDAKAAAIAKQKATEEVQQARVAATPVSTEKTRIPKKKTQSIDEMFSADYHVSHLARHPILTYQQVEDQYGIRITGFGRGINPTDSAVILISSIGKSSGKFVYHDKWTKDGDYLYSGEGRTGDQTMTKGNLAIKNAKHDGKQIHLFVKFSPQEYYYQGIFTLVDYTYEDEKDGDGNTRKEYKFRLRKAQ